MRNTQTLSIGEVAKMTGLSARALRFYEEKELISPARTDAGRRVYGESELLRLHQIVLLRRADFSLRQIGVLLATHDLDATEILSAQIQALEADRNQLDDALTGLRLAKASLDATGHLDIETLCGLIQKGDYGMSKEAWQEIINKNYNAEELEHWKDAENKMPADFDQEAYSQQWTDLGARIEAALPLDPTSDTAQGFVKEWDALLAPFLAVADDTMKAGTARLWGSMDSWPEGQKSPLSKEVWEFISTARS